MSNINLLPDDLKKQEEKELQRLSRKPKENRVEWNNPVSDKPADLYSDVPKESLWSNIFGTKNAITPSSRPSNASVAPEAVLPISKEPKIQTPENYSDIPKAPKNENKKNFSFSDLFGPATSPMKASSDVSESYAKPYTKQKQPITIDYSKMNNVITDKTKPIKQKSGNSWLDILGSLFAPHPKKVSWKMAGDDASRDKLIKESLSLSKDKTWENYSKPNNSSQPKGHPAVSRDAKSAGAHQVVSNDKNKEKKAGAKSQPGKYHLADKREASGININLIPEELISMRKPNFTRQIVALLAVIILSGLVVGGMYYFIDFNQSQLNKKIAVEKVKLDQLNSELSQYHQIRIENYDASKKILAIDSILKNHVYWTKFFSLLEQNTLDSTYYSGFSASVTGKFSLPVTTKSYGSALSQVAALNSAKDFAKEVNVESMHIVSNDKKGAYGVGFDLKINLADGVFKK
ncbi:MAG: hypothetical protein WC244_04230 [Patescibacteria group bacterium]|jgi:hypothetical protein